MLPWNSKPKIYLALSSTGTLTLEFKPKYTSWGTVIKIILARFAGSEMVLVSPWASRIGRTPGSSFGLFQRNRIDYMI